MFPITMDVTPAVYNRLPVVEDADKYVNRNDLVSVMTMKVGNIFLRHEIEEYWGIGLLHHHWPIYSGEKPAEDMVNGSDGLEYITKPQENSRAGYVPSLLAANNLAVDGRLFSSLEFSSDQVAGEAFRILVNKTEFLADLYAALVGSGLQNYFGLSSLKAAPSSNLTFMEYTQEDRASVLRLVSQEKLLGTNFIQTGWSFSKEKTADNCKRSCAKLCNVPAGGGHYSSHTALHNPNG